MNFTLRQLRCLLALASEGSVGGAARVLHVTQPTASMQLKDLAEQVGLPLYEVVSRRVHLTETGQQLVQTARAMEDLWENFQQQVAAQKGMKRGSLKVAVVSTAKYFIPRLLGSFCREYPEVELALQVQNRDGVVHRLENNLDDLYIMSQPPAHVPLHDFVFMKNPLVVIAPVGHPLASRRKIRPERLNSERFILREPGSGTRMAVQAHLQGLHTQQVQWQVKLELGNNEAIRESVAAGLGLAVLSRYALPIDPEDAGVCMLNVQGFPIDSHWHVVFPRGKQLSPLAQAFLNILTGGRSESPRTG
ncbi:MAG: LysR family transcriptional regulator [Limnobacter sp.]|nr:LysR family transcriptional regulator [Limnobacter sp.]